MEKFLAFLLYVAFGTSNYSELSLPIDGFHVYSRLDPPIIPDFAILPPDYVTFGGIAFKKMFGGFGRIFSPGPQGVIPDFARSPASTTPLITSKSKTMKKYVGSMKEYVENMKEYEEIRGNMWKYEEICDSGN